MEGEPLLVAAEFVEFSFLQAIKQLVRGCCQSNGFSDDLVNISKEVFFSILYCVGKVRVVVFD